MRLISNRFLSAPPAKFLLDALSSSPGGGQIYLENLAEGFVDAGLSPQTLLVAKKGTLKSIINRWAGPSLILPPTPTPIRFLLEQLLPFAYRDLALIYPANFSPIFYGSKRSTLVVQNLHYFRPSDYGPPHARLRLQTNLARRSVRSAQIVVCISSALAGAVSASEDCPASWLRVVRSAAPYLPEPVSPPSQPRLPFLLSIGNDYRHKNLDEIVSAWAEAQIADTDLVLVGSLQPKRQQELSRLATRSPTHGGSIHMLGTIADRAHISWYLHAAAALVSASDLEAYPLTPEEGLQAGCRLILSDIEAHREVAGPTAHYFEPHSVDQLRSLIEAIINSPESVEPRIGRRTWTDVANEIVAVALEGIGRIAAAQDYPKTEVQAR